MPIHLLPLKPLFPKWYDANVRYDYRVGILGYLTENCIMFKYKVQGLVKVEKLKFENLGQPDGVKSPLPNSSWEEEALREKNIEESTSTPNPKFEADAE